MAQSHSYFMSKITVTSYPSTDGNFDLVAITFGNQRLIVTPAELVDFQKYFRQSLKIERCKEEQEQMQAAELAAKDKA